MSDDSSANGEKFDVNENKSKNKFEPSSDTKKNDATHVGRVTTDATPPGKHQMIKERLPKCISTAEFTVRTRWVGKYFKMGIHKCALELIRIIREVDPYMHVMPTTENSNDIITHEDDFIDTKSDRWIRNPWCIIGTANEFAMRFRCAKSFRCIKEKVINFMAKTGNGARVDCNLADRVVTIGFFDGIYNNIHNKNQLKKFCCKFLKEEFKYPYHIEVYPRKFYVGHGKNMVKGTLVALEVSYCRAETMNNAMLRCNFEGYRGVTYVPFMKFDDNYTSFMRKVLVHHSTVNERIESINIPLLNHIHPATEFKNNKFKNVRELLLSFNDDHPNFLYDIDKGRGFSTTIMYNIDAEKFLEPFVQGFKKFLEDNIQAESLSRMFLYKKPMMNILTGTRRQSVYERDHVKNIFSKYGMNNKDEEEYVSTKHRQPRNRKRVKQRNKHESTDESEPTRAARSIEEDLRSELEKEIEKDIEDDKVEPGTFDKNVQSQERDPPEDDKTEFSPVKDNYDAMDVDESPISKNANNDRSYQQEGKNNISNYVSREDLNNAVAAAISKQNNELDETRVQQLVNTASENLRNEMKKDRLEMQQKIEGVNEAMVNSISLATAPFTAAINSMQASQLQFMNMFQNQFGLIQHNPQQLRLMPPPLPPLSHQLIPDNQPSSQKIIKNTPMLPAPVHPQKTGLTTQSNQQQSNNPANRLPKVKVEPGAKI